MVQIPKKYFYLQYIIKVCACSLFLFYCLLMKWKITHKNFDVYIIFMKINWKNMNIWQPWNSETGNPAIRNVPKASPIDNLKLHRGSYQIVCLYHHFCANKLKKYEDLATLQWWNWQPCWSRGFENVPNWFLGTK